MRETVSPPQYLRIAQDMARRIAKGELAEGTRIYGRSLMASEYGVSPETIRRAMRLLADMKVLEVKPQSGVTVLSADSARRYMDAFDENDDARGLRRQVQELMAEYEALGKRLSETVTALVRSRNTFAAAEAPLPNYELPIPPGAAVSGKSIGELNFWQTTGGTIVAIRRGQTVILSPGPYAQLYSGDVVVLVGSPAAVDAARGLLERKEAKERGGLS